MGNLQELIAQRQALDDKIEQTRQRQRKETIEKVRALMAEQGLTLADLSGRDPSTLGRAPSKRAGIKVPIKYRDPSTGNSWSGRGLQPNWLKTAIANGRKLSDFLV